MSRQPRPHTLTKTRRGRPPLPPIDFANEVLYSETAMAEKLGIKAASLARRYKRYECEGADWAGPACLFDNGHRVFPHSWYELHLLGYPGVVFPVEEVADDD